MYRFIFKFLITTFFFFISLQSHARVTTLDFVNFILANQITDEIAKSSEGSQKICLINGRPSYDCKSYISFSQGICLASNRPSYECPSYISLAQAICLNGGRPSYDCPSYISQDQAICRSTGRPSYDCPTYINTTQAICLARGRKSYECASYISLQDVLKLPVVDASWAWDRFRDSLGNKVFLCRGRSTGQFADYQKCSTAKKNDDIWPGNEFYF